MVITRDIVQGWIDQYYELKPEGITVQDWIRQKVDDMDLEEPMVNTVGHDNLEDETPLVEMIIMDLPSYDHH